MRRTLRSLYHRLPLPWRPPKGAREFRRFNEEFQWRPLSDIREHQLARLRALIRHAEESVPHYAGLFREIGFRAEDLHSLEDLRRLPLLDKEAVRRNPRTLTARDWKQWRPETRFTGGSTGQRLAVLMGERAQHAHLADVLRSYHWAGYDPGQRAAFITPNLGDLVRPGELGYYHRPRKLLYVDARLFSQETLARMVALLVEFRPEALLGPPSHLYPLSAYVAEKGEGGLRPRTLLTTSEILYDFQRAEIERVFGARIYDFYGMAEHVASAAQCEAGAYHLGLEYTYVEVLRPDGTPAEPGEVGEIVGTNLENYAMPLIRYRTGDLAIVGGGSCPCRRTLPALSQVSGRTLDLIVTPNGLAPFRGLGNATRDLPNVKEFQIIQDEVHRFRIRVAGRPGYHPEDGQRLAQLLERSLDYPITVEVELAAELPRTERGKLRLVECRVPSPL